MAKLSVKAPGALSKQIAAKIRTSRIEAGLTQLDMAEALGVTFQQVQKYERGDNRVSPDRLQRIAEMTRKPITYFFAKGDEQEATTGNEVLAAAAKWMGSDPIAHSALRALSKLSGEDVALAVSLMQRLAAKP